MRRAGGLGNDYVAARNQQTGVVIVFNGAGGSGIPYGETTTGVAKRKSEGLVCFGYQISVDLHRNDLQSFSLGKAECTTGGSVVGARGCRVGFLFARCPIHRGVNTRRRRQCDDESQGNGSGITLGDAAITD